MPESRRFPVPRWLPSALVFIVMGGLVWSVAHAVDMSTPWRVIWLSSAVAVTLAIDRTRLASSRTGKRLLICTMTLLAAGSLFLRGQSAIPKVMRGDQFQGWNVYHYYMGSKYFDELGYFDLYKYTFLADREGRRVLRSVKKTRNLHDYSWVRVDGEVASIEENAFTPDRWDEFKADLKTLFKLTPRRTARRMVTDLGYNATPFGHLLFGSLSSNLSLADPGERTFLLGLDWLVLIPAFLIFGRAFGAIRSLAMLSCFMLFFGTFPFQFGGMLRFSWLAATLVAISCYKLGHYKTAGIVFALAVAERVLPVFMLVGPAIHVAWRWWRTREFPRQRAVFGASFLAALSVCLFATLFTGRGARGWAEFGENMLHHASFQYLVEKKFGVKRVFSHDFANDKQPRSANKKRKRQIFHEQEHYYWAALGLLGGCIAFIYAASDEHNSMLVGMLPAFLLEDISKYYLILWFLLFCVGPPLFRQRYKFALFDIIVVGLIPMYYVVNLHSSSAMVLYTSANLYMIGTVVVLAGLLATGVAKSGLPTLSANNPAPDKSA